MIALIFLVIPTRIIESSLKEDELEKHRLCFGMIIIMLIVYAIFLFRHFISDMLN